MFWYFLQKSDPRGNFFLYVKLLISLLNIAFFRLGKKFSVRGHGAKFLATPQHQLSKQMVGTPHGSAGLGKNQVWMSWEGHLRVDQNVHAGGKILLQRYALEMTSFYSQLDHSGGQTVFLH